MHVNTNLRVATRRVGAVTCVMCVDVVCFGVYQRLCISCFVQMKVLEKVLLLISCMLDCYYTNTYYLF